MAVESMNVPADKLTAHSTALPSLCPFSTPKSEVGASRVVGPVQPTCLAGHLGRRKALLESVQAVRATKERLNAKECRQMPSVWRRCWLR